MHNVAVLDYVSFAFLAGFSGILCALLAAVFYEIIISRSIAYFSNPKIETKFTPIQLPPALAKEAIGSQNIDPNDPVFNVVGANILKTRLRAHPDVAAKFYS